MIKRKFLSFLLAIIMLFLAFPLTPIGSYAVDEAAQAEAEQTNLGSALGCVAKFKIATVFLYSDPQNNISDQVIPFGGGLPETVSIVDYYSNGTTLWYKIVAAPGYTWPDAYADYHYVRADSLEILSSGAVGVLQDGILVTELTLPLYDKITLTAESSLIGSVSYQWQICAADVWIDIYGADEASLQVSFGLIADVLDENLQAKFRVQSKSGSKTVVSDAITVTLAIDSDGGQETASAASRSSADAGEGSSDPTVSEKVTVTVRFVYGANGDQLSADQIFEIPKGSDLNNPIVLPVMNGYDAYLEDDTQTVYTTYTVAMENVEEDTVITFRYWPAKVNYTVIYYWQNIEDDDYLEHERRVYTDFTGNIATVEDLSYEGFYQLLYESVPIASDSSTVIEVYYDRLYYKLTFNLDGGYGVQPIYARYGTEIDVPNPTKAGNSFVGWDAGTDGIADALPQAIPAHDSHYTAIWKEAGVANVTIVFWGENADNEEYSYIKSQTISAKPGTELTSLICSLEAHTHSATCQTSCRLEAHSHSADCYQKCGKSTHTHSTDCYSVTYGNNNTQLTLTQVTDAGTLTQLNISTPWGNEVVRIVNRYNYSYYIKIDGTWYQLKTRNNGNLSISPNTSVTLKKCGQEAHTHTDDCLSCGTPVHSHIAACYACVEHTHTAGCYSDLIINSMESDLWTYVKSDTITVKADGSSVMNVYYDRTTFTLTFEANEKTVATITDKWEASISEKFEEAPFNTTYNGRAWECTESTKYSYALQTLDSMPQFNAKFNLYNKSSETLKTIYYYVEKVGANVSENTWPSSTDQFELHKQVDTYFTYATYEEEYHKMQGFERFSKSVSGFSNNRKNFSNNQLYLYYLRSSYSLEFNNGEKIVSTHSVEYESPLGTYEFTPEPPSYYESGSVQFDGWYLNPECSGEEFKLDTHTMPASNLLLYAKWTPVHHTVRFFLDETLDRIDDNVYTVQGDGETIVYKYTDIEHGQRVQDPHTPPNDPQKGQYLFIGWFYVDALGNEQMWDFESTTVTSNVDIYAKWSSNILMPYEVKYVYRDEGGNEIEIADRISGSALGGNSKTFNAKGNEQLYEDYRTGYFATEQSHTITIDLDDTSKNTYTFYYVKKDAVPYTVHYLDAATNEELASLKTVADNQKAIVTETYRSISGYLPNTYQQTLIIDPNNPDNNKIVFYYTKDDQNGMYVVHYMTENLESGNYSEHSVFESRAVKGTTINAPIKEIENFTHDPSVNGTVLSGTVSTEQVLHLYVFYTRNQYPYKVQYLKLGTNQALAPEKLVTGKPWDSIVTETAPPIDGYAVVGSETASILIRKDTENPTVNIITFYYSSPDTSLTVQKNFPDDADYSIDANQTFLFEIKGADSATAKVRLTVTVHGAGQTTVSGLPIGKYTITELTDWSWRYDQCVPSAKDSLQPTVGTNAITVSLSSDPADNVVQFTNTRSQNKWLDGDSWADNRFDQTTQ